MKTEQDIKELMYQVCGKDTNYRKISTQIKAFQRQGLTLQQIYETLAWWYKVKKENPANSNGGIGIVPYVVQDMEQWKEQRREFKEQAEKRGIILAQQKKVIEIERPTFEPIGHRKRGKMYKLD